MGTLIDLEQLKKSNDHDWHKAYGGQITLNCEDVDILLKAFDKACLMLEKFDYEEKDKQYWKDYLLSEVSK